MRRLRADFILLFVALIWGVSFVAQKEANAHVGPVFFIAVRFLLSALFLAPFAVWEARARPVPLQRSDWRGAILIGLCLCGGCWFQQIGLVTTTASNAGFLTAVYIVIVPFVTWAFTRDRPRRVVLVAVLVATAGAWMMAGGGPDGRVSRGDLFVLAGDLVWAAHIALVGYFARAGARPIFLSCVQCAITGLVSLPAALLWQPATAAAVAAALPSILYAGILSSGVAFTLQIVAQRHTPAAEAALIMSLESVFSAIAGARLLGESLTLQAAIGAALILLSVVLVGSGAAAAARATAVAAVVLTGYSLNTGSVV